MVVTAGLLGLAEILDQGTYVPTLTASTTNPTLGTGGNLTQAGWWKRVDDLIIGGALIRFGTTAPAAGSGTYYISLPFAANTAFHAASDSTGLGSALGIGGLRDNSVPTADLCQVQLAAAGNTVMMRSTTGTVTAGGPWAWAASDALSVNFVYQADPAAL
jgi:hypothetical protein